MYSTFMLNLNRSFYIMSFNSKAKGMTEYEKN